MKSKAILIVMLLCLVWLCGTLVDTVITVRSDRQIGHVATMNAVDSLLEESRDSTKVEVQMKKIG